MKAITVSQLNYYTKSVIEADENLKSVAVTGEISNFKYYSTSGHMYFSLKDEMCSVSCVMFASSATKLQFRPKDGMSVVVKARVSLYERDGKYQLYVSQMEEAGKGTLAQQFEELKNKLYREGLFELQKKLDIPAFPLRIGIATSLQAAALQDIRNVTSRRWKLSELVVYPCQVQGDTAAPSVVRAIEYFQSRDDIDLIIVARGGGSSEDLYCFNDETLARKIANCRIPVISAVGHETDFTIIDFVSALRAPTPSAAAELAVPDVNKVCQKLNASKINICNSINSYIKVNRQKVLVRKNAVSDRFDRMFSDRAMLLDRASDRLSDSIDQFMNAKRNELSVISSRLYELDPLKVLSRGYAGVFKDDKAVSSVTQIDPGDSLCIKMKDGEISCAAEEIRINV